MGALLLILGRILLILKTIIFSPATKYFVSSAIGTATTEIVAWMKTHKKEVIIYAAGKALGIDIEVDEDGNLSEESITNAINAKFGTSFTNIFDKEAIKADLEKIGMDKINENLGEPVISSLRDKDKLREDFRSFVSRKIEECIDEN